MIISREKGWVVITPPKTGSTTLHRLLCLPQFKGSLWIEDWQHNVDVPAWAADFRRYLSVRDPYARASSLWRASFRDPWMDRPIADFGEWARRVLINGEGTNFYHAIINDWVPGDSTPLRLEHFADDLKQLEPDGPYVIPNENADPSLTPWTVAYDRFPGAWEYVTRWAELDFNRFGYEARP